MIHTCEKDSQILFWWVWINNEHCLFKNDQALNAMKTTECDFCEKVCWSQWGHKIKRFVHQLTLVGLARRSCWSPHPCQNKSPIRESTILGHSNQSCDDMSNSRSAPWFHFPSVNSRFPHFLSFCVTICFSSFFLIFLKAGLDKFSFLFFSLGSTTQI